MNPHTPPPRNDDELTPEERELAALYRQLPEDEPGHALDEAILARAERALGETRSRRHRGPRGWMLGVATAATLVLAGGLAWRLHTPSPIPAIPLDTTAPALVAPPAAQSLVVPSADVARRVAAPATAEPMHLAAPPPAMKNASPAPLPAPPAPPPPVQEQAANAVPPPVPPALPFRAVGLRSAIAPMAAATAPTAAASPQARIHHIRHLLQEGHRTQALAALRAFKRDYPDHSLPDDLKALEKPDR